MSTVISKFGGLAEQLVSAGLVSDQDMRSAQTEAQQQRIGLVAYLVDNK